MSSEKPKLLVFLDFNGVVMHKGARRFERSCVQRTFYVGTMKGVGRIYQQTFIDTYSKVVQAKLYTTKTPITAADLLNDRVLPLFEHHELPMLWGNRNTLQIGSTPNVDRPRHGVLWSS